MVIAWPSHDTPFLGDQEEEEVGMRKSLYQMLSQEPPLASTSIPWASAFMWLPITARESGKELFVEEDKGRED